jgi:hypothetical protein
MGKNWLINQSGSQLSSFVVWTPSGAFLAAGGRIESRF